MKRINCVLSLFLTVLLIFGSAPAAALAGVGFFTTPVSATAPDASGTCGANATWEYYHSTGLLTVSGSGNMYNYDNASNKAPWSAYRSSIKTVEISNGITSVGSFAFRECSVMTAVSLPGSLLRIERNAFSYSGLTSITIPSGVTYFGNLAFGYCASLSSIVYNAVSASDAESSGVFMLSSSQSVKPPVSVQFGNSVQRIPGNLFYFMSPQNALNITSVSIGASVKTIGEYAFYNCNTITSLSLPEGLIDIRSYAINNCTGITSITIPESVTTLHDYAVGYNDETKVSGFTISVYRNSAGLAYAQQKGFNYILLNPIGVTGVSLNKQEYTLFVNGSYQLIHTVWPLDATNQDVTWKSYNTAVAEVNSTGLVYAKAPGTAVIEVKTVDGECPATCTITVATPTITLSASSASIYTEDDYILTATITPADVMPMWYIKESNPENVVSIDARQKNCIVTGLTEGTATVEAKILINGIDYFAHCDFNVTQLQLTGVVINSYPNDLNYFVGETLDTTGLALTASYNNHADKTITSGFECSPTLLQNPGTQQIAVTYRGYTNYFDVEVEPVVMTGIDIVTPPAKTSYYAGDTLITDGIEVQAVYNNGARTVIESGLEFDTTTFSEPGIKTVNVSYNGFSDSFSVTVTAVAITGIAFETEASVTSYFSGDTLDTTGLTIRVNYNNGNSVVLDTGFTCSPTALNVAGTQQITVSYEGFSLHYNVFVTQTAITSIAVETEPDKKDYYVGDTLDTAGLTVRINYNSGKHDIIDEGFRCNPTTFSTSGTQEITVTFSGFAASFNVNVTAVVLTGIEIVTLPDKLEYFTGDSLNTEGLTVKLLYNSGKNEIISTGFVCSPTSFIQSGTKTVTVSYGGFTKTFNVTVADIVMTGISINTPPSKTEYFTGEALNISGLTVKTHYNNGTFAILTSGFSCNPSGVFTAGGAFDITVTYEGFNATFEVNVTEVRMTGISIFTEPSKLVYITGETLNTSGLTIKTHYNNGFSEVLTSGFTCSPAVLAQSGTQEITVSYNGFEDSFNVTVTDVSAQGISIRTLPAKTVYFVGDSLQISGLTITVSYNNGQTETVTEGFSCSPTSFATPGTKTVTVSYLGFTAQFNITVNEIKVTGISIKTPPSKTSFIYRNTFSSAGLTISVNYNNGTSDTLTTGFECSGYNMRKTGNQVVTVKYNNFTTSYNITVKYTWWQWLLVIFLFGWIWY